LKQPEANSTRRTWTPGSPQASAAAAQAGGPRPRRLDPGQAFDGPTQALSLRADGAPLPGPDAGARGHDARAVYAPRDRSRDPCRTLGAQRALDRRARTADEPTPRRRLAHGQLMVSTRVHVEFRISSKSRSQHKTRKSVSSQKNRFSSSASPL